MRVSLLILCVVAASGARNDQAQKVSPIQKVITMLTDMLAKGKKEKQDETVRFAAFNQFCTSTAAEKAKDIAAGKAELEQLDAEIAKAGADAQGLAKSIAGLDADVATWSSDLASAKKERADEKATYEEAHAEYITSIGAVKRAMTMLQKGPGGKVIEQSILQEPKKVFELLQIPEPKRFTFLQKISPEKALLQEAEDEGIVLPAAPQAKAFEGSSGGVIDLVERLGEKFEDEKRALEKAEANAISAFELMSADLSAQIESASAEKATKVSTKAARLEAQAEAKGEFADTAAAKAEDEKYLNDLDVECKTKTFDYEQRQIVRQGEIEAIEKAIEIMGTTTAADPNAAMVQRGVSLVQLRSSVHSPVQDAVASFLEQKAGSIGSRLLALVASKAAVDPFKKVKKMIQEMITKLMEEANEEAEHKSFCDTEMTTNKQTRDKKTELSDTLSADIEGLTADIAKLGTEITELGQQIAEIDAAVLKATSDRNKEKADNQASIADAKMGAEAVGKAIAVLKEFYDKAAVPVLQPAPQQGPIGWDSRALQILKNKGAAALAQMHKKPVSLLQVDTVNSGSQKAKVPGAPEMEEGSYTGMSNGGVLGLMEVCESDFNKVVAETSASESEAARDFDKFIADSKQDKAVKETDQGHKKNSQTEKASNLATAKKDLRITQDELHAAMQYYEKLKPDCEAKVMSYEEKVAQRKAEIESLQEALSILAGENI